MARHGAAYFENVVAIDQDALRTRSRADIVYHSLLDGIWEGRFAHGERLREEEIARALGVSRTPVREALQRLQQRGLLTVGAGRGLVIAQLTKQQILELYAMREILEGSAAHFAAQHAHPAEIEIIDRLQKRLAKAQDDAVGLAKLNRQFHQAIYEAAHNQYLLQTLDSLHDSLALLHGTVFRMPNRRTETDDEHRLIVAAIEDRDPDRAEKAAREHIKQAQRTRFDLAMK
jgi:DNA-binding GntR family transcriptional regulator